MSIINEDKAFSKCSHLDWSPSWIWSFYGHQGKIELGTIKKKSLSTSLTSTMPILVLLPPNPQSILYLPHIRLTITHTFRFLIPSLRSNDQSVLYFVVDNISVSVYLNAYLANTCERLSSQINILFIIILFKTMATLCTY